MDDDDEEGSRGIPSRTRIGKQAAIIEKFPSLGNPLVLFGGLITIPFWGYRNLSCAYIDIMLSDMPRIEYRKEKEEWSEDIQRAAYEKTNKMRQEIKQGALSTLKINKESKNLQDILHR